MEEYLQYMKTLRSHMNDVEDQAAKASVEEQMQTTTTQILMKEIELVNSNESAAKSEKKRLKEDSDLMMKAKGHICSQILERQRKLALLENDSSTLSQTLELIQQERVNLSTKLVEKRTSYGKTEEEMNNTLKEQQVNIQIDSRGIDSAVIDANKNHLNYVKKIKYGAFPHNANFETYVTGNYDAKTLVSSGNLDEVYKNTMAKVDAAKAKFDTLTQMRFEHASERHKDKQSSEELKHRMDNIKPELRDMASETLEEELQALMSDKRGETEYQESLQNRIDTFKGISNTVNCGCGEEYKVEVDLCV
ncbi:hypothetical protein L6452_33837 [Arctium lappa]|uniref:Uncharacterized protein n=1 Tax=Arctium lappa TaxID=4217 RepID=A0ACB8YGQ0_ARCLA|nr:hypothetical protein L6452_33837 [Arctium lappa]